jgi:trk system potassium uptake protein
MALRVKEPLDTTVESRSSTAAQAAKRPGQQAWLDVAGAVLAAAALAAVLLEAGHYRLPPGLSAPLLHGAQSVIAGLIFLCAAVGTLRRAPGRSRLRRAWPQGLILVAAVAAALLSPRPEALLAGVRVYLLASVLLCLARLCRRAGEAHIAPSWLLPGGFLMLVFAGAGLLMLPTAVPESTPPLYFIDALFTAASAATGTGLAVCDTASEFSPFGLWVILGLMQLGALAIIFAGCLLVMGIARGGARPLGEMGRYAVGSGPAVSLGQLLETVVLASLLIELAGACLLVPVWGSGRAAVFAAIFHSVAAFSTAGFTLQKDSLVSLRGHWQVMVVIPLLMLLGGVGLPVLIECGNHLGHATQRLARRFLGLPAGARTPRLSLQTRLVLAITLLLTALGPLGILLLDPAKPTKSVGQAQDTMAGIKSTTWSDWQQLSLNGRIGQAWFQGVAARGGGAATMDLNELSSAGRLWVMGLMVLGGAPASPAGGFRTVGLAILLAVLVGALRRRERITIFGSPVSAALVRQVLSLAVLYALLLGFGTLALSVAQGSASRFMDVLFESVSAYGTAGLSLGETLRLSNAGKIILTWLMLLGRLLPLTLLLGLLRTSAEGAADELVMA